MGHDVTALAAEVAHAARRPRAARSLILDIDGTLAPIARTPEGARVPRAVLASLSALVDDGWRIAIVSGRPAAQARAMVPVPGVTIYGCHGVEREGGPIPRALTRLGARLGRIAHELAERARGFPGVRIERKPIGVALHDRTATARVRGLWRRALHRWLALYDLSGLEVLPGKRVLEIRPAGLGKGIIARVWPPARRLPRVDRSFVVIGDDRSDEEMLEAFASRGETIRVGGPHVRTAARRRLPSPSAVGRFLSRLAEAEAVR